MSPEFLIKGDGMELAITLNNDKMLGLLAIDEAHCTSVWGHDFRNDYLLLGKFRESFPKIPILAVTATATLKVVDDIVNCLKMEKVVLVRANFDRPNLFLRMYKHSKYLPMEIYKERFDKRTDPNDYSILDKYIDEYTEYEGDKDNIYKMIQTFNSHSKRKNTLVDKFIDCYQKNPNISLIDEYINKYITDENDDRIIIYANSFNLRSCRYVFTILRQ